MPEPGGLAVVGSLTRDLEVEPLIAEVGFRGRGGEGDGVGFVVGLHEVLVYGAGFPEGQGGVGVDDSGDAPVRADIRGERGL